MTFRQTDGEDAFELAERLRSIEFAENTNSNFVEKEKSGGNSDSKNKTLLERQNGGVLLSPGSVISPNTVFPLLERLL